MLLERFSAWLRSAWRLVSSFDQCEQGVPVARVRSLRARAYTRASRERKPGDASDRVQSIAFELWHDLALVPRTIAPSALVLARPAIIAAVLLGIRFAALAPSMGARARVVT
jgi:hypothetical protein